jgi:hypothetical protein
MTDDFEDRLRHHLAGRAAGMHPEPDPTAFVERSAGRSHRRGVVAGGVAALALVAGAGVLTGVNLVGATSATQSPASAPSTTGPGRAGAALAPGASGSSVPPSIAFQTPYTFLYTRVSSSGVTIRAYTSGSTAAGGCAPAVSCTPPTTNPQNPACPSDAMCAEPIVVPHSSSGTTGTGGTSVGGAAPPGTTTVTPVSPPNPASTCDQLVIELSTDRTIGSGSVLQPIATSSAPDTLEVLGTGSFGSAEGAPVSWVVVWVGSAVGSVQLTVSGTSVDAMTPHDGIVVLAAPGDSGLAGASVVGVDQSGATVATVPASQGEVPADSNGCPTSTGTPPSTTTTTDPAPTTTTTTTPTAATTAPGAPVPGPNLPAPASG